MNQVLEFKLYEKYPNLFSEKDLSPTETCMCWGIECGDGWYKIIDTLCEKLTNLNDRQLKVVQVKEKYGTLRIYLNNCNEKAEKAISKAEELSEGTCEMCGKKGRLIKDGSWYMVRCEKCLSSKTL